MFWAWNVDFVLWRGACVEGRRDVDDDVLVKTAAACGGTVPADMEGSVNEMSS